MAGPTRQSRRYPVRKRTCSLFVINFKNHEWKDHHAQIVDISRHGVGLESTARMEEGFVWFRDRVGGFRGGVLMWSRQIGEQFRAGIRFVPLSIVEETTVRDQIEHARIHKPLQIPERIIATIMASMTKISGEGYLDASDFVGNLDLDSELQK
jgi:hypothetical protein